MSNVFSSVLGNHVGRSVFDLSHTKRFDCDMGQLIPSLFLECVPGDTFKLGVEAVTRFQPLVAPILDSVDMTIHYFFVPTRLLMDGDKDWETFLSGGKDGNDTSVSIPRWNFGFTDGTVNDTNNPFSNGVYIGKYSLWDYFGLPVPANNAGSISIRDQNKVIGFPQRAYNLIWNEYYRDQNVCDEVSLTNSTVLYRAWKKDYFTSSLPWRQRGVAPALPIVGNAPVSFSSPYSDMELINLFGKRAPDNASFEAQLIGAYRSANSLAPIIDETSLNFNTSDYGIIKSLYLKHNLSATANLSAGSTFDVATLREAFQIQRWLELNARGGVRYTEFLKSHFGISPRDEVLQRPEYIGGTKSSVVVSEVLQTSASTDGSTPQGHLAGHGLGAVSDFVCSYTAKEFGYIVGIASWMPKPSYQQGVNRIFSRNTRYDFYFPEFAHLSEQAVTRGELYATGTSTDTEIFGYQSAYNEMRYMPSINAGGMRDTFKYWHLGRIFTGQPTLNAGFLTTNSAYSGGIRKDIFASQSEPGLLVQIGNLVKAIRPMPVYGTPGLIDHVGRM